MPASRAALCLQPDVDVARPGRRRRAPSRARRGPSSATSRATSARIRAPSAFPSISVAVTGATLTAARARHSLPFDHAVRARPRDGPGSRSGRRRSSSSWRGSSVDDLRAWIPVWLPIAVLLAAEVEFVLRGRRGARGQRPLGASRPGPEDADLGFGELVEDEDGIRFVPPPARPVRARRRLAWFVGASPLRSWRLAVSERPRRDWQAALLGDRARAEARFTSEAAAIAGRPVTGPLRRRLLLHRRRERHPRRRLSECAASRTSTRRYAARSTTSRPRARRATSGRRCARRAGARGGPPRRRAPRGRHGVPRAPGGGAARRAARPRRGDRRGRCSTRRSTSGSPERNVIRAAYALPSSCRDGGALDRRPGDARFPF